MFPEWTWVIGFWIGAAVGSFLNVVIYRLPRGLSINSPKHSFCPTCKRQLGLSELVPILSWAAQKGKCKCGKAKIGGRYVLVELVNGALWAGIWWLHLSGPHTLGEPVRAVGYMLFASCLVAAIFTDLAHYIIPDQVNAAMLVIGLVMNLVMYLTKMPGSFTWGMPSSIAGALVGVAALWGIAFLGRVLFRKDAMGHGDIKMARGIGAVLFPLMAGASFGLAIAIGAVIGLLIVVVRRVAPEAATGEPDDDEPYAPEGIGSLLMSGAGYLLCVDVVGLVFPKLYEWWFKENPYAVEEFEDEPKVELTMIPFGPYLAVGALAAIFLESPLRGAIDGYFRQFS